MTDTSLMHRTYCLVTCVFLVVALGRSAGAGGIVLESYTGDRPRDANRLLSPILDELATRGFSGGDTLARTYDTAVSRAALTTGGLPSDFAAQAERGFKAWVAGKFDEAIKILGPLVDTAHANTGAFAIDQTLRDPLRKAMIALALSHQRGGDTPVASETLRELVRSFPETQLARGTYGPDAAELFEQVKRDIGTATGKLTVNVSDRNAVVFIDELIRHQGTMSIDLLPGEYRVCVMLDQKPSRSHKVVIRANENATLIIDARLDQVVHTSGWTGFQFGTQPDRDAHEALYASRFATGIGASAVAVIGIEQVHGHSSIVGSLVSLQNGRELRRAGVATDPDPSTERLRALARFLAGDEPAAGIEVQTPGLAANNAQTDEVVESHVASVERHDEHGEIEHGRWGGWKWIAGGAAAAAVGTGVVLIALDGGCRSTPMPGRPCNDLYSTATPGKIALGVGAALAGAAVYLFVTEPKPILRGAFITPTSDGVAAGFATRW